jgi:hypothetical protein
VRRRGAAPRRGCPRRARGGALMPVAQGLRGKVFREEEKGTRKLTTCSIWVEGGRRGELDARGGGLAREQRRLAEEVKGEVGRLGARGIEARRRGVAGADAGSGPARLGSARRSQPELEEAKVEGEQ